MNLEWYDWVGIVGTVMVLGAFFLLQARRLSGNGLAYQLLNLFGAGGVLVSLVGGFAVLAVPLLSWGIYGALGSPDLPAQPLQARLSKLPSESTPDELVARAENALRQNPNDGRGWDVIAPVYQRMGRANELYRAIEQAADEQAVTRLHLGPQLGRVGGRLLHHEPALGARGHDHCVLDALGLHEPEHFGAEVFTAIRPSQPTARDLARAQVHTFDAR